MKSNRVLIVSQHFPPEIGAASNRMEHLTRHLDAQGFELFVVTSQPRYPNPKLYKREPFYETYKNTRIYRVPSLGGYGTLGRILQMLSFLIFAAAITLFITFKYKIKICITTSPPFTINSIGWLCKIVLSRKWIMEVRDLWPDSMAAVGAISKNNWIYKCLRITEKHFYRVASKIIVVTPNTKEILSQQGINAERIEVITNGIPDWVYYETCGEEKLRNSSSYRVIYVGNLGKSQDLMQLLKAAKMLQHLEIEFIIIGDGLEREKLTSYCSKEQLSNIKILPAILDKMKILNWYHSSDLGVVSLKDSELFRNVIPSKLFEYAGAGLPILYIGDGEGADLIRKYGMGRRVDFDPDEIASAILRFYNDNNKEKNLKVVGRAFRDEYSWYRLSKRYGDILSSAQKWGKGSDPYIKKNSL